MKMAQLPSIFGGAAVSLEEQAEGAACRPLGGCRFRDAHAAVGAVKHAGRSRHDPRATPVPGQVRIREMSTD